MKLNSLKNTKTKLKAILAGLLLLGTLATKAQCSANFTYTLGANGSVTLASTSTGTSISTYYSWNFGGSSTANGATATHTYSTNGAKSVCLTIISNTTSINSCSSTVCDTVHITTAVTPTTSPCSANFGFYYNPNGSVTFVSTSTGTTANTAYSWSFGPGSGSGLAATTTYTSTGKKLVCLTIVTDTTIPGSCTSTKCDSVLITTIPTTPTCSASFTPILNSGGMVLLVSTSSGTNTNMSYTWNFGDTTITNATSAGHTYTSTGAKVVCLTIYNPAINCTSTKCDTIFVTSITGSVTPCLPTVVYTLSKDTITPLTWSAYPSYPSNITNATWYWGDGSSTTGLYPSHTYSAAGTYSTCVTISVSCGTITASYCYVAAIFRSSQSNDMITVNVKQAFVTGIKNLAKANGKLNIYPNPNSGEFTLEFNATENELKENTVTVYNMVGEKVFEKHVLTSGKQTIDVNNLPNGTYLVKINSDAGYLHKTITIQK